MEWYRKILGNEWKITPAGGLTGDAYIAEKNSRRLFLKRNSSPFLAVLSAEGIVPKLIWTKRLENGDVITAQEWLEGRILRPEEMSDEKVVRMLHKIHHSSELLHMLMRMGIKPITPKERYMDIKNRMIRSKLIHMREVDHALTILEYLLPHIDDEEQVVCHGDINHHNFLLSIDGKVSLIDWDTAMIADPIIDYGKVLNSYIAKEDWDHWLLRYGMKRGEQFHVRMYWYLIVDSLFFLFWHHNRQEHRKVRESLKALYALHIRFGMSIPSLLFE